LLAIVGGQTTSALSPAHEDEFLELVFKELLSTGFVGRIRVTKSKRREHILYSEISSLAAIDGFNPNNGDDDFGRNP
jgi:hypothetical protein